MPKDTSGVPSLMPDWAQIMADMDSPDHTPVDIPELPSPFATQEIRRTPRTQPIPDMASFVKLWHLIGEGSSGKSFLARHLVGELTERDKLAQNMIAALAPGNRNLTGFTPVAMQPPTSDPAAVAAWGAKALTAMRKHRRGGIWDFGGGDTSMNLMIRAQPDMVERAEQDGVAIVAAYTLSTRVHDLVFLKTFERLGYRPRATLLILNLYRANNDPSLFNDVRRQPEYKAALDRGAVEVWMPMLDAKVAQAIDTAGALFTHARDGVTPEGKKEADIQVTDRSKVRIWLETMRAEFGDVERAGWMPWT